MFDEMLRTGLSPSIVTYNCLLASFANLGAWREALDVMTHVRAAQAEGVNPNSSEPGEEGVLSRAWVGPGFGVQ